MDKELKQAIQALAISNIVAAYITKTDLSELSKVREEYFVHLATSLYERVEKNVEKLNKDD